MDGQLAVRPYRDKDEPHVLELHRAAYGRELGADSTAHTVADVFRWKHRAGPLGPSIMFVAEHAGQIVGFRAWIPWPLVAGERAINAARQTDAATRPEHQGTGVFSRMDREGVEYLRTRGVELSFGTPNERALRPITRMGSRLVARLPISVRVRRPLRFASGLSSRGAAPAAMPSGQPVEAETVADVLADPSLTADLLAQAAASERRLTTARGIDFLRWRYGPPFDYRAVWEEREGRICGLAIFRLRPRGRLWESSVVELIVPPGDRSGARRLLRAVVHASPADYLTCHFRAGSPAARAAARTGFVRSPSHAVLAARPLARGLVPDPTVAEVWALSLGDLEVVL